jgi:metal-sulfur cluster biosynthetic enzyme
VVPGTDEVIAALRHVIDPEIGMPHAVFVGFVFSLIFGPSS